MKNDNATLVIGSGNYLIAPAGTAKPADLTAPGEDWENIGHTSLEEILAMASEGGEATVLGTLQNKQLRTTYSTRTEAFTVILQQFDESALRLYYGANSIKVNGMIAPAASPEPTEVAYLAVFLDGSTVFGIYAPRVEIFRAEDWAIEDTESLAGLPISVTPLNYSTNEWTYAVTPLGIVATGADAGTPGEFTPEGASPVYNLAGLTGITASPSSAWTAGQYVKLGDLSKAHWNGTAWAAGVAA